MLQLDARLKAYAEARREKIGRIDDALLVRGVVVYPSAIENVLRRFPTVTEFSVEVHRHNTLD